MDSADNLVRGWPDGWFVLVGFVAVAGLWLAGVKVLAAMLATASGAGLGGYDAWRVMSVHAQLSERGSLETVTIGIGLVLVVLAGLSVPAAALGMPSRD